MISLIAPHLQLDNVLELSLSRLDELGLRGLLLDLDGTLKDYHATAVPPLVQSWLQSLRQHGIRLCLVSNGKHRRIGALAATLGVPFVAKAFKPLPFGCRRGLKELGVPIHSAAIVGDQLFADVLAGRLAGLFTILVRPTSLEEPWFTRLKRPLERTVLRSISGFGQPRQSKDLVFDSALTPGKGS